MRSDHHHASDRGITSDIDAREAARRMVRIRVKAVELLMPLALEEPVVDVENVHQLRVSTRRAGAALRVFGRYFPARRVGKLRRQLGQIRRAASLARECDVFREMISERLKYADPALRPDLKKLRRWTKRQRTLSQELIQEVVTPEAIAKLRERREALLDRIEDPAPDAIPQTFADLARDALTDLVAKVEKARASNLSRIKNLHRLRIRSKRLRYALEIFRPCLGEQLHHEIDRMKSIQDRLGDINDVDGLIDWVRRFQCEVGEEASSAAADHDPGGPLVASLRTERAALAEQFIAAIAEGDLAHYPRCILDLLPPPSPGAASASSRSVASPDIIVPIR